MQERFSQSHIDEYCRLNIELFKLIETNYEEISNNEFFINHIKKIDTLMLETTEYVP